MKAFRLPYFTCRFALEGLNLERFINTMSKAEIPLLSLKRTGIRTLICECYQSDMPAITILVQEKGWKLSETTPLHLAAFFAFLRKRWGIPVGLCLMIVLSIVMYQFVWRIEIRGSDQYHGDIAAYLIEEKLTAGIPKNCIDASALSQALNRRYPDVAWFNVYVHDITLVVDASPGVPMPQIESATPADIVASRDAVISSVLVYAGTPAVKAFDIVRKGQVLIRGTERGADESLSPVNAQGIVMARCWRSQKVSVPLYDVYSESTGRTTQQQQLCTPWLSYPASLETPSYLAYDTEVLITPMVGSFFPIWVKKTVFHEVSLEYAPRDPEQVKLEAAAAAMQKLLVTLKSDEIVDKWVDYCMIESTSLTATATVELLMDIASYALP